MAAEGEHSGDQSPMPGQRPVTREGLADNERKQAAYAAARRVWTRRQLRPDAAPPEEPDFPEPAPQDGRPVLPRPRRPRTGLIHDKRQAKMEF